MREPCDAAETRTSLDSQLERPACPLCGGQKAQPLLEAEDDWNARGPAAGMTFEVHRCESCRACFTSPRFREESKHLPFLGNYPFYERARRGDGDRQITPQEMRPFARRARLLQRAHPVPGRVLDLGMGDGAFLTLMRANGWSVCGIDNEPDVIAYARKRLESATCLCADVERDPLAAGPFDAVTMWGVLQLVYRPQSFLEKVRGVLRPGGIVGIGVSNFGGAGARLFRKHWRGLGLPRHLVHFEPPSLRRLVERSGYEVLQLSFETPYWIAGGSVRSLVPGAGLLGGITRRSLAALLGLAGRTRLGDTMTLIARRK